MRALLCRICSCLLPRWTRDHTPDPDHFYRRCFTAKYRAKKRLVRDLWIGAGAVMLLYPVPGFVLIVALLATFTAFTILDETA